MIKIANNLMHLTHLMHLPQINSSNAEFSFKEEGHGDAAVQFHKMRQMHLNALKQKNRAPISPNQPSRPATEAQLTRKEQEEEELWAINQQRQRLHMFNSVPGSSYKPIKTMQEYRAIKRQEEEAAHIEALERMFRLPPGTYNKLDVNRRSFYRDKYVENMNTSVA